MDFAGVLLFALLSQASGQSPLSSATIRAGGHTYQLYCAQQGELIRVSDTGVCQKTDSGGVQRFEIRNEDGEAQFFQDAPADNPFGYVAIFAFPNPGGREILEVDTSPGGASGGGPKSRHVSYFFDLSATGLIPFHPALVGIEGFAQLSSGVALSRTFDAGFFQFSVLLGFNTATHGIDILPGQTVFSALAPRGREKGGPSAASGTVKMYNSHDSSASAQDVRIARGHMVSWWESLTPAEKPASGQVVTILAAWAPASLRPADNALEGVEMVYYDWNNLWLQIQVDDHTGWIKGSSGFRTIGLEMVTPQR